MGTLVRDPSFNAADVHVFEFAMWYELFDALLLVAPASLVVDHNTTPPELVDDPVVKEACARASLVRHNLHLANGSASGRPICATSSSGWGSRRNRST